MEKFRALTEQAKREKAADYEKYDSIKDRPLSERCLLGFGSTSGPPMLPVLYNNNYQIVQTPDTHHDHGRDGARCADNPDERERTHPVQMSASGWAIRSAIGKATRWWWTRPISRTRAHLRSGRTRDPRRICT